MRATEKRTGYVRATVEKYCKQIGIPDDRIPVLIFTKPELRALRDKIGMKRMKFNVLGTCYWTEKTIFINLYHIDNKRTLDNVIIHELVHYRWHWIPHGLKFEKRIKEIKRGMTFPSLLATACDSGGQMPSPAL